MAIRRFEEERRNTRSTQMASGTLACPECDAPVAVGDRVLTPPDPVECPYCDHSGPVRQFLSLASPARPARVAIHVR